MLITLSKCANPGTPQGGPKDELPPVVEKSEPAANALNFKDDRISIVFNELIQLKDVTQKLVVSPPFNKQPTVMARGEELYIRFEEELQENTTYTLDFADAIADNNEGNVLENFSFSFSTGEIVDSFSVSGFLWNAVDLAPMPGVMVFIHENKADSAFNTLVPVRLAKTSPKGAFTIKNVRPGSYRIYALDDANRNYIYDQPGESIAWSDSIVVPAFTHKMFTDSIGKDSVYTYQKLVGIPDSLHLFMFQEDIYNQYVTGEQRKERAKINVFFNEGVDSFKVVPLKTEYTKEWYRLEWSGKKDSLTLWIADSSVYLKDTLSLAFQYAILDSLKRPVVKNDTIPFYFFEVEKKESRRKKDEPVKKPVLQFSSFASSIDVFGLYPVVLATAPVESRLELLHLFEMQDTIPVPIDINIQQDSLNIRRFTIDKQWKAGTTYKLVIDSAAFKDVYGLVNNAIEQTFTIKTLDSYGKLYVKVSNPQTNWLVQILNSREQVVRQALVPPSGKMAFSLLKPGEYMLRMVVDTNGNGDWDTGNYSEKKQPEEVFYYPDKIALRANWEQELKWDRDMFDRFKFAEKFRKSKNQSRP